MRLRVIASFLCLVPLALADYANDLASIHVEAIGGLRRLTELKSLRATGHVTIRGISMETSILAEAPNHVRTEIRGGGANLIQAYDGINPPWQFNDSEPGAKPRKLDGEAAAEFIKDAEFTDPLMDLALHGRTLAYLGSKTIDGRKLEGLRIIQKGLTELELWLDASTYFIVRQLRLRKISEERTVQMETLFSDFRPVRGVVQPRHIKVLSDSKVVLETKIEKLEANPVIPTGIFTPASLRN